MGWDDTTIPLRLRRVRVITVLENTPTRLKAEIRSGWSVSRRPPCGHKCRRVHNTRPKHPGSGHGGTADDAGMAAPAVCVR